VPVVLEPTEAIVKRPAPLLWVFFLIISAIKLSLYIVDPGVKLVLGDSGSYLATAISGWVPPDRSYTYGLFLGLLLHFWHSLNFLVVVQVALSAMSAMLLSWVLYRVLNAPVFTAGICGIVCALEPLQLLSERYILSEAISTFFFAVVICLALGYLTKPRLRYLLLIAVSATLLVSFRVYFLPAMLITSVFLPVASHFGTISWQELKAWRGRQKLGMAGVARERDIIDLAFSAKLIAGRLRFNWRHDLDVPGLPPKVSRFALHLVVAVVSLQVALFALRVWYGYENHAPSAYIEEDGFFLLADLSPIVDESDFRNRELGHRVFSNLRVPQHEKLSRLWNRWAGGGLIDVLTTEIKKMNPSVQLWDENKIAKRTAIRAVLRHPLKAAQLVTDNVREYFSIAELRRALIVNEFVDVAITPNYQQLLSQNFGWKIRYQGRSGLVREWHQRCAYWCFYLLLCPAIGTLALLIPALPRKQYLLYCLLCAWPLWCVSTFLPEEVAPRYFTGLAWLLILVTGLIVQGLVELWRFRSKASQSVTAQQSAITV
jgi:hypothetical protein